jgi:hypothetical protein
MVGMPKEDVGIPLGMPQRGDDGHAKGGWWVCLKRMWSFPWVCLGRMVIPLDVSKRESGHSLDGPNKEWSFP